MMRHFTSTVRRRLREIAEESIDKKFKAATDYAKGYAKTMVAILLPGELDDGE